MAMQEAQAEPSMEEILASIRRIISEEDQPGPAEVLDLTQPAEGPEDDIMVFEEPPPVARAPAPAAAPQPAPAPVEAPPPPRAPEPPAPRVAAAAPQPVTAPLDQNDPIVSEPAAHVTMDAFSRLAGSVRVADAPGQTLEGMIRQLVRPMLKEWLDAHLPAIVEAKVEAELDRISRLSR